MLKNLPSKVHGITVERNHQESVFEQSTGKRGVLHDTEGFFEGDDSTLRSARSWPNALVGRDHTSKIRIIEYAPIGAMARALVNAEGGTETNREAVYQIEVTGKATTGELLVTKKGAPTTRTSLDNDPELRQVIAALMIEVRKAAGVPLRHVSNTSRSISVWDNNSGWFGHVDVPENFHHDPGGHKWDKTFSFARALLAPWKVVKDGVVFERGSISDVLTWIKSHRDKVRKVHGVNVRPNT